MISFAAKPTLEGDLVLLRPVREADVSAPLAAETLRLTGTHRRFSMAVLRKWYRTRAEHQDRLDLSIIDEASATGPASSC